MSNAITKAIGNAFLYLGSRIAVPGIRPGDLTAMLMGEETNPRSRRHQVIRIFSSAGHQVCWEYNCKNCGNTTPVDFNDRDQKIPCVTCKQTFSIKEVIHELIRTAQTEANVRRGAHIDLTKPITREDFALAVNSLPAHIPSQVTSPAAARLQQYKEQLKEVSGDVIWTGSGSTFGGGPRDDISNSIQYEDAALNGLSGEPFSASRCAPLFEAAERRVREQREAKKGK